MEAFPGVLRASELAVKAAIFTANRGSSESRIILPAMEDAVWYGEPFMGPIGNVFSFSPSFKEDASIDFINQVYFGPVVTLTNPQSASSSDIYAGFKRDYNASYVIGTDEATAGAGATKRTYRSFQKEAPDAFPGLLPEETDFTTAYIRACRYRPSLGALIEHRGVKPDERYYRTRDDVLNWEVDLIQYAIKKLSKDPSMS